MDVTITTIYCLCDAFLKAMNHRPDDPQARLSTADVTPPSRHWLFVLSLIVLTAMVSACAGSNEPDRSSSSADATAGGDATAPSSTGAGIGSNLLWAVAYGSKGFIVVGPNPPAHDARHVGDGEYPEEDACEDHGQAHQHRVEGELGHGGVP